MFKFLYSFILSDNKQDQGYIRASKLRFNTIIQYFGLNIPVTPPPPHPVLHSWPLCYAVIEPAVSGMKVLMVAHQRDAAESPASLIAVK